MRAFLICLFLSLTVSVVSEAEVADILDLTDLVRPVSELTYHARLEVPRHRKLCFSIVWNYCDSANYRRADIEAYPVAEADVSGRNICVYAVREVVDGAVRTVASGEGAFSYATEKKTGFSAVLTVDATGACLSLGGEVPEVRVPVVFDAEHPGQLGVSYRQGVVIINNLIVSKHRDAVEKSRFSSSDEVLAYISASDDVREGLWEYLDRDLDPSKTFISTGYRLATVADGAGGYEIVKLSGEPGVVGVFDIKGKLLPTSFIDHYDLSWLTADGVWLRIDTSADIEQGGAVLRFNFPLVKASVRFRRLRPSR